MKNNAFTLIEIIITLAIIAVLFSTLMIGKTKEEERLALQRMAYQLAQDLREAQEMAMGAGKIVCDTETTYNFGVHFNEDWKDYYMFFADCDKSKYYEAGTDKDIKKIPLEEKVQIKDFSPIYNSPAYNSVLDIVFTPPDPIVRINGVDWDKEASIIFSLNSYTKTVKINSAGRIEID